MNTKFVNGRNETAAGAFAEAWRELQRRNVPAAIELFHRAEAEGHSPDECAAARWKCHMLLGEYEAAWRESDAIGLRGQPDAQRLWDGQPFDHRHVMVRCLHGLGDTLQYARYATLIRERAVSLTIEAQPALKDLLRGSRLADHVITWGDAEPHWDQQVEIVELPRIFRTTVSTIPKTDYLGSPAAHRQIHRAKPRIGLVWTSGTFDPNRSLPLQALERIVSDGGAAFFSFQGEPARQQLRDLGTPPVEDLFDERLLYTAERLRSMDLLITVDTMMAHLAGALNLPVWTLLAYESDWRWMMDRSDSPWYPSMTLFRQSRPGDWEAVIEEVRRSLREWIKGDSPDPVFDSSSAARASIPHL